jgi:hypothetical protein
MYFSVCSSHIQLLSPPLWNHVLWLETRTSFCITPILLAYWTSFQHHTRKSVREWTMMLWDWANLYSPIRHYQLEHPENCSLGKSCIVYGTSLNPGHNDVMNRKGWAWPHSFKTLFASWYYYAAFSYSSFHLYIDFVVRKCHLVTIKIDFTLIQEKHVTEEMEPARFITC